MTSGTLRSELERLNACSAADFVAALGGIYEHSPWVAERTAGSRPFRTGRLLHDTMQGVVQSASPEEQLALIRAHPELAGREAVAGILTQASASEQGRLGLDRLSRSEFEHLAELNRRYRDTFAFPCIIALRLHPTRESVLAEFERRISNSRERELATALEQIGHIARGRLAQALGVAGGRLTTHVLDTANGIPAAGMSYALHVRDGSQWRELSAGRTNANGRTDLPLLSDLDMAAATYRLEFEVGVYFRGLGTRQDEPAFLDVVPLEFATAHAGQHYHVPLLCSPWSFSTYRGS